MAVYTQVSVLYADIQKYMDRNEDSIVAKIPLWVRMAEGELDRRLRHPASQVVYNYPLVTGSQELEAPRQLTELRSIRITSNPEALQRRSPEELYRGPFYKDEPEAFASVGNKYILNKPVEKDTTFEFVYYTTPIPLSVENSSNLYLDACGDILLYMALSLGFAYDNNQAESAYWRQMAEAALESLQTQIKQEAMSGSTFVNFANTDFLTTYF